MSWALPHMATSSYQLSGWWLRNAGVRICVGLGASGAEPHKNHSSTLTHPPTTPPAHHSTPQGLNVALYWKNPDPRHYVNVVPTSAITGTASH